MDVDLLNIEADLLIFNFEDKTFSNSGSTLLLEHKAMEESYAFLAGLTGVERLLRTLISIVRVVDVLDESSCIIPLCQGNGQQSMNQ